MTDLTFDQLTAQNVPRAIAWHSEADALAGPSSAWTGADWSNAMGGECGEAQNVVKKLRRIETGLYRKDGLTAEQLLEKLGEELADTIIYADLLAHHYGIDLPAAIITKFNSVSIERGFSERLPQREPMPSSLRDACMMIVNQGPPGGMTPVEILTDIRLRWPGYWPYITVIDIADVRDEYLGRK